MTMAMTKKPSAQKRLLNPSDSAPSNMQIWKERLFYFVLFPLVFFTSTSLIFGGLGWYFSQGWIFSLSGIVLAVGAIWLVVKFLIARRTKREKHIQNAPLPPSLSASLLKTYPHLSELDAQSVGQGLRDFFLASLQSKKKFLAMPSQAVDVLWHEFILHTRSYDAWCKGALGYFLHHTPAAALGKSAQRNDGLRRIWYWACLREGIDPRKPDELPFLFGIDAGLAIPDGFHYQPDCGLAQGKSKDNNGGGSSDAHCGTHFSSGNYSGSGSDFGGAESSSDSDGGSSSSSDGGGGGDGGGGCGGGGD
jgi:hypothetical protein